MPFAFLNPALLLGLLGAAVPLVVHLLGRRKARELHFPAIAFLLASQKRLAARRRLRNLLLLLVRVILLAAIVFAIARPLMPEAVVSSGGLPVSVVVILDQTASMGAKVGGEVAFERGQALVSDVLSRLPVGSEVTVIAAGRRSKRLTDGFATVLDAVEVVGAARPGMTAASLREAITEASFALESARWSAKLVYVASDLQASTWDFANDGAMELDAEVLVLDVMPDGFPANIGLTDVRMGDEATGQVVVDALASPAPRAASTVVRMKVGDSLTNTGIFEGGVERPSAILALPNSTETGPILLELADGGSLGADDRRFLYRESREPVRVLVANGAPHANMYRDEVFYLERALELAGDRIVKTVVDATDGHLGNLDEVDVVILANVERLGRVSADLLEAFVRNGGGLLTTVGDRVDATRLGVTLGPLLPARPRAQVRRRPGEPPIRIATEIRTDHPVVATFASSRASETLGSVTCTRFLSVEVSETAETLLQFSNGLPALVAGNLGRGRTALLTTTVDRDWTDLPVKPAYLPLMSRLVMHLAGALHAPRQHDYLVGDVVALAGAADLPVAIGPGGVRIEGERDAESGYNLGPVAMPGAYRVEVAGVPAPSFDFVVNLDATESNLTRVTADEIRSALGGEAGVGSSVGAMVRREDQVALPLLGLLVAAFLLESLLGRRRGSDVDHTEATST